MKPLRCIYCAKQVYMGKVTHSLLIYPTLCKELGDNIVKFCDKKKSGS